MCYGIRHAANSSCLETLKYGVRDTHVARIDVDLQEDDVRVLVGQLLEERSDHLAGAAPGGGEIDHDLCERISLSQARADSSF